MGHGTALVLPGRAYPPVAPLLDLAGRALTEHGWDVRPAWWEAPADLAPADAAAWVDQRVLAAVAGLPGLPGLPGRPGGERVVVVAKSLGTRAAPYVAARGWPAVWLTPLTLVPDVVDALRTNPAPQLVVAGLADPFHDPAVDLGACELLALEGADHALVVPGAVRTAELHVEVARVVDDFLTRLEAS
ncbi:MAG: hypothetical protein CMH83_01365 [Nocardioides sp.]|nr:hypothetical protein [Nocardioides sp.]